MAQQPPAVALVPPPPQPPRLSSDDGRPRYYSEASEEDSLLLYQRDELMNSILEEEDALITEHRKHIEYTMTVVRLEMSLLTEVAEIHSCQALSPMPPASQGACAASQKPPRRKRLSLFPLGDFCSCGLKHSS